VRRQASPRRALSVDNFEFVGEARAGHCIDGEKAGKWVFYFESGVKRFECVFFRDLMHGVSTWWYENGVKCAECEYHHGVQIGDGKHYSFGGDETQHDNTGNWKELHRVPKDIPFND
jgi:antitoxin component YwqK of YwqJK toxin-antitoxin module